jgi:SagB-type dehydrogenase family enzyme
MLKRLVPAIVLLCPVLAVAGDVAAVVPLPKPQTEGGKPLFQALKERHSTREFDAAKLSPQTLSNLLWAAAGVNRADGRRTAPTANNRQETDLYLATADGLFLYEPKEHRLRTILTEDIRALAGQQDFVKTAPLNLIYVADYARMGSGPVEEKLLYSGAGVGFIAQNVYLFCASEGLATVVRAMIDRPALAKAMKLGPEQHIVLSQTVGYPKKQAAAD